MDIHKPKAAHSIREFLIEIGTITCGILIALGLEQVAEAMHWSHKIHEAQRAMRLELAEDDGPQAYARLITVKCFDSQLDALERLASDRGDRRAFRKAALAYSPPNRTWDQHAWQTAVASDVGTHMGAYELEHWSGPYRTIAGLQNLAFTERNSRTAIAAVRDVDGPLTEAEADRAMANIAALRDANSGLAVTGWGLIRAMKAGGIEMTDAVRGAVFREAQAKFGSCVAEPTAELSAKAAGYLDNVRQFDTINEGRAQLGLAARK